MDLWWNLPDLLECHGFRNRAKVLHGKDPMSGVGENAVNAIYDCMDVFMLPTVEKMFGLPILEAIAAYMIDNRVRGSDCVWIA